MNCIAASCNLRASYGCRIHKNSQATLGIYLGQNKYSGELNGISKLSIWSSASADHRNTFSFICVSCGACTQSYFAQALISGLYINLICFRIYDLFDFKKTISISRIFHVLVSIILYLESDVFLFDRLLRFSFQTQYCYTDFLVKYWDKLIFHQISAGDLFEASFQLTAFDF